MPSTRRRAKSDRWPKRLRLSVGALTAITLAAIGFEAILFYEFGKVGRLADGSPAYLFTRDAHAFIKPVGLFMCGVAAIVALTVDSQRQATGGAAVASALPNKEWPYWRMTGGAVLLIGVLVYVVGSLALLVAAVPGLGLEGGVSARDLTSLGLAGVRGVSASLMVAFAVRLLTLLLGDWVSAAITLLIFVFVLRPVIEGLPLGGFLQDELQVWLTWGDPVHSLAAFGSYPLKGALWPALQLSILACAAVAVSRWRARWRRGTE